MALASDLRVLYRLAIAPVRGRTHQERLESFYRDQASDYDQFREKLLHGRRELYQALSFPSGGHWIEMGGGTGASLEYLGPRLKNLDRITLVDLSPSLLQQAEDRCKRNHWTNVEIVEADVTKVQLPAADVITFSYSLTMIPAWYEAVDHAVQLLHEGGLLGAVDFFVSRRFPACGQVKHNWFTRHFWPTWFATDNVMLSPDHVPYLSHRFETISIEDSRGKIPFMPLMCAPYYRFVGRRRTSEQLFA